MYKNQVFKTEVHRVGYYSLVSTDIVDDNNQLNTCENFNEPNSHTKLIQVPVAQTLRLIPEH